GPVTWREYRRLGGAEFLLANYVDAMLERLRADGHNMAPIVAVLEALVDPQNSDQRLVPGLSLKDITLRGIRMTPALERGLRAMVAARVLEHTPDGYYRLLHERLIDGIRRYAGATRPEQQRAEAVLRRAVTNHAATGSARDLLTGRELRLV